MSSTVREVPCTKYEKISLANEKAVPSTEYDAQKDVIFFDSIPDANKLTVGVGEFAIFFPHDIHRPAMAVGEPSPVSKIVVKVRV